MAEYIEREVLLKRLDMAIDCKNCPRCVDMKTYYDRCAYTDIQDVCGVISDMPATDVQPVDTKEILRHLDSLMICVCNAYNTSHYLLESDMKFIEKQEKIIKGLLSNKPIKG